MFTGIVQTTGRIASFGHGTLSIETDLAADDLEIGESIAVDGCCLTVVSFGRGCWQADVSDETLARTTLGRRSPGDRVNLERAVRLQDRLGGHLVQGHVDGVGEIVAPCPDLRVRVPSRLLPYVVEKGSITVDGVSLTVVEPLDDGFTVAVIPHTAVATTLGERRAGDLVNLEADVMAKYAERLLAAHLADTQGGGPAADRTLERSTT